MSPWEKLAGVMIRQHSVTATWQAEAVGVSRQALAARVKREAWPRYFRGVTGLPVRAGTEAPLAALVVAYARPTGGALRIAPADDDEAFIRAVVDAALRAGHAISGRSGVWRHGFGPPPRTHELWLPYQSGRLTREGVRLRYGGNPSGDIGMVAGLPTLDPEACVIETARTPIGTFDQRVDEVIWQMARGDSKRLLTVDSVERRFTSLGSCCGGDVLERAIDKAKGELSHSRPEGRGRELAREALTPLGLAPEPRPHAIFHRGQSIAEADIAVLPITLDIEVDGPHHRFVDQQLEDQRRDRKVRRARWEVERFSSEFVDEHPKLFVARVREAAQARMSALGL
jgi:hypothetical protein